MPQYLKRGSWLVKSKNMRNLILITLIVLALVWSAFARFAKNDTRYQHCITRATVFTAAAFIILAM
jgi:hypothetical protein